DDEAGSSAAGSSQRRSTRAQVQEPHELEGEVVGQILNADADLASDGDGVDDAVQPQPREAPEEGYGGGPRDMSLLHAYHKHRAIAIWDATSPEDQLYNYY
ncbi:hypothetical protein A2U01_0011877, partial [Trifolium medium]|nr:hypothetical protein [Trifolium medium]